jgi:hypothetical protein
VRTWHFWHIDGSCLIHSFSSFLLVSSSCFWCWSCAVLRVVCLELVVSSLRRSWATKPWGQLNFLSRHRFHPNPVPLYSPVIWPSSWVNVIPLTRGFPSWRLHSIQRFHRYLCHKHYKQYRVFKHQTIPNDVRIPPPTNVLTRPFPPNGRMLLTSYRPVEEDSPDEDHLQSTYKSEYIPSWPLNTLDHPLSDSVCSWLRLRELICPLNHDIQKLGRTIRYLMYPSSTNLHPSWKRLIWICSALIISITRQIKSRWNESKFQTRL